MTEGQAQQKNHQGLTLEEIAKLTNATFVGDGNYCIRGVADLDSASREDISFLANLRYQQAMERTRAGAVIVDSTIPLEPGRNYLVTDNPSRTFQEVIEVFYPLDFQEMTGFSGIHATAVIHPLAKLGKEVSIGPYAVIDKGAIIGDRTVISAGSYIGLHTVIGTDCLIHPHVVIRERCVVGDRVILQPGAIVGSCGFGYIMENQRHVKLNQIGTVHIENDVEVGANTTIDRARFKVTLIKKGTKIDNLVQIAHGVTIGEHNIIVAQTGIAGSTETGKGVLIGGQVAIDGHLKIADGVRLAARSGVSKSLPTGTYSGAPTMPIQQFNRTAVLLRNIETYVKQIKELQQKIEALEKSSKQD